ncbi:MAG: hypothetical protein DMF95_14665 [Acidobacteria bacterium]|nr:MAG: hypothetical protein DMF95_14665 [Acidobacteriota bacterium]
MDRGNRHPPIVAARGFRRSSKREGLQPSDPRRAMAPGEQSPAREAVSRAISGARRLQPNDSEREGFSRASSDWLFCRA